MANLLLLAGCGQGSVAAIDDFACTSIQQGAAVVERADLGGKSPRIVDYIAGEGLGLHPDGSSPFVDPVYLVRLPSGDTPVLDQGLGRVLIIHASPGGISSAGRVGEGPGEFGRSAHQLFVVRDSSFGVIDPAQRLVVEFNSHGKYVRTTPSSFGSGPALAYGSRSDGKIVRFDAVLLRSAKGQGQFAPAVEMVVLGKPEVTERLKAGEDTAGGLYTAHPIVAVEPSGDGFVLGSTNSGTLAFMDWQGNCTAVWRGIGEREEIDEDDKRFLLDQGTRNVKVPDKEAFLDRMLASVGFGAIYPRFTRLVLSRNQVWIELPTTADQIRSGDAPDFDLDDTGSRDWLVVSKLGKVLQLARLPVGFKLFAVTNLGPLGIGQDSNGIGPVQLLRPEN